jgi:hypothetical protein
VHCYTFSPGLRGHRGGVDVKVRLKTVCLVAGLSFFICASGAWAGTTYVSQNGGTFSGGSACNGKSTVSIAASNNATYAAGETIYLCGVITSAVSFGKGSGTSGNPITILFDAGARITLPYCNSTCFSLGGNYMVVDGGVPCGPGTACAATEAASPTGYPEGISGIIEATQAGSALANKPSSGGKGIVVGGGSNNVIRNLIVRNIYQHTSYDDNTGGSNSFTAIEAPAPYFTVHDCTIHDVSAGINVNTSGATASNENFYSNNFWNINWGIANGGYGTLVNTNWSVHDNHFGSTGNWDDSNNTYHHDRMFLYADTNDQGSWNGVYIYNNLFDGNSGLNSTAMLYFGGGSQQNTYIFNNVFDNSGSTTAIDDGLLTLGAMGPATLFLYNNTIIGAGVTVDAGRQGCVVMEGHITFVNNVVTGCDQLMYLQNGLKGSGGPYVVYMDYNTYGAANPNKVFTHDGSPQYFTSLPSWREFTGQESHSTLNLSGVTLSTVGVPLSGSPAINAGLNMTTTSPGGGSVTDGCGSSLLSALCSDTTLGSTRTPLLRPSSGAWTTGAFVTGGASAPSSTRPAAPTNLGATVN